MKPDTARPLLVPLEIKGQDFANETFCVEEWVETTNLDEQCFVLIAIIDELNDDGLNVTLNAEGAKRVRDWLTAWLKIVKENRND
jgi:hypothetical protein